MSDRVGAIINKDIEVVKGRIGSFINNFMASANGCKMPYGPTMLGPFRSCMYPKILRSTNVRKARYGGGYPLLDGPPWAFSTTSW